MHLCRELILCAVSSDAWQGTEMIRVNVKVTIDAKFKVKVRVKVAVGVRVRAFQALFIGLCQGTLCDLVALISNRMWRK